MSVDPLIAVLYERMNELDMGPFRVSKVAGVDPKSIQHWTTRRPTIYDLRAALQAVGVEITYSVNAEYKPRAFRGRGGSPIPLTREQVQAMAKLREQGMYLSEIGRRFGVGSDTVRNRLNDLKNSTGMFKPKD